MPFPAYNPVEPPASNDPTVLANWAMDQFAQIAGVISALHLGQEKIQYTPPKQVYDGLIMLADGTRWNPGSGKGFYGYYSGAWHFLG
jgi:hypothetical protein